MRAGSNAIVIINKGTEKIIKITAKIIFIILIASITSKPHIILNNDLILIKKQYKNSIKSSSKKGKEGNSDKENEESYLAGKKHKK